MLCGATSVRIYLCSLEHTGIGTGITKLGIGRTDVPGGFFFLQKQCVGTTGLPGVASIWTAEKLHFIIRLDSIETGPVLREAASVTL